MSEPSFQDQGVIDTTTGKWMTRVAKDPKAGEYSVDERGTYRFSRDDDGHGLRILAHDQRESFESRPPSASATATLTAEEIAEYRRRGTNCVSKAAEGEMLIYPVVEGEILLSLLDEVERSRKAIDAVVASIKATRMVWELSEPMQAWLGRMIEVLQGPAPGTKP